MGTKLCFGSQRSNSKMIRHGFSVLFLGCFVGSVLSAGGSGMLNDMDMMKKWSKYKAMEACYGEDITKTQLLKMKRAIAKCSKVDMPELDLPMFKTPYRAIQALLNGAREMEKMMTTKMPIMISLASMMMKNLQKCSSSANKRTGIDLKDKVICMSLVTV